MMEEAIACLTGNTAVRPVRFVLFDDELRLQFSTKRHP